MSNELPSYIASAAPVPAQNRVPWYKSTAPTYAGIMLWFVFWDSIVTGGETVPPLRGTLSAGIGVALLGIVIAALICHFCFYLVPGLLGTKTGLPLYIVGTSTFGAQGGFLMPGFLMGVLQFGWLGVNAFFSGMLIYNALPFAALSPASDYPVLGHTALAVVWALLAAFVGLKGIQYVARVATYLPLIPLGILLFLLFKTIGTIGGLDENALQAIENAQRTAAADSPAALSTFGVLALISTYIVGFFATAGAAGVDFGMNNRNSKDVQLGGLTGIALATIVTAGFSLLIVAGVYGSTTLSAGATGLNTTGLMGVIVGDKTAKVFMFLLALAAFPPACFSSFIAANSFKTTLPKVHPYVSVGAGTLVSIILAASGWAGDVIWVFKVIGASFGPICGAMMVDYFLAGRKWSGPRAGFNPAGWIAWILGFGVGALDILRIMPVPAAPVVAFIIGAVVYGVLAKIGIQSRILPMAQGSRGPAN